MEKMKRFIDCYIPVTTCNLRCKYCYITQNNRWGDKLPKFDYDAGHIGKALSRERLGGVCHINMCGGGETLLPKEMTEIIKNILEQGHYIMVVTNGTVTKRFNEIVQLPKELLNRLGFKFSFHYEELIRLNKLEEFFNNIKNIHKAGCSFSLEITPNDNLIYKIDEIKQICIDNLGAPCHVTVARDDKDVNKPILTKLTKEEYKEKWNEFNSDLFKFKMSTFNIKRKEFCYAGDWSLYLNLGTGVLKQCYCGKLEQNIFEDLNKPIKYLAIGNNCTLPHCYNSHAFMTLGNIPSVETPTYSSMRNRVCEDGTQWLQSDMRNFLSSKLFDGNEEYGIIKKQITNLKNKLL